MPNSHADRARRIAIRYLLPAFVGLVGAWIGLGLGSSTTTEIGPFEVRVQAAFGRGDTEVALPPFGRVAANTHTAPLLFTATLVSVDVDELTTAFGGRGTDALVAQMEEDALNLLLPYFLRVFAVAALGAFVLALLVYRRNLRAVGIALGATALVLASFQLAVWRTYEPAAFHQPRFSGALELAPQLIGPVGEVTGKIDDFRGELQRIAAGASHAYAGMEAHLPRGQDHVRVLHISDIHLSPFGLDFARQLADSFDVDFVLDTGDIAHFGTPLEHLIVSQVARFEQPYVFVRGNHDSPAVGAEMRRLPNTIVLDGEAETVEGITIYGLAHPVFTEDKEDEIDHPEFRRRARAAGAGIARHLTLLDVDPDVVAVHDDRMAELLAGRVPLVLSGHFHKPSVRVEDGTLYLRVGTTGASGVHVFDEGEPMGAKILYFERAQRPRLVAYDLIEQDPQTGSLSVRRLRVDPDEEGFVEEAPGAGHPEPGTGAPPGAEAEQETPAP